VSTRNPTLLNAMRLRSWIRKPLAPVDSCMPLTLPRSWEPVGSVPM
jgi:hypothetical protein